MLSFLVCSVYSVSVSRVGKRKVKPQWNMALICVVLAAGKKENSILGPSRMSNVFEKEMGCLVSIWQLKAIQPLDLFERELRG